MRKLADKAVLKNSQYCFLGINIILTSYNQNIFIWGAHVFVVPESVVWEHGALSLLVISGASILLSVSKNKIENLYVYIQNSKLNFVFLVCTSHTSQGPICDRSLYWNLEIYIQHVIHNCTATPVHVACEHDTQCFFLNGLGSPPLLPQIRNIFQVCAIL